MSSHRMPPSSCIYFVRSDLGFVKLAQEEDLSNLKCKPYKWFIGFYWFIRQRSPGLDHKVQLEIASNPNWDKCIHHSMQNSHFLTEIPGTCSRKPVPAHAILARAPHVRSTNATADDLYAITKGFCARYFL